MAFEIRPVTAGEYEAFVRAHSLNFNRDFEPESVATRLDYTELDRTLATFDGPEIVGTAAAFSHELTVPGGAAIKAGGVSAVTVAASHRRKGILTSVMRRQLEDIRDRGELAASLWASESGIYGRFGYGMAAESHNFTIDRAHAGLSHGVEASGRVRLIQVEEAAELLPVVFEKERARRPGFVSRSEGWWKQRVFGDPPAWRGGFTAQRIAVYEEGGTPLGTVRYRAKGEWQEGLPDGKLHVIELIALTPAAYGALWAHVLGVDLMSTIEAGERPGNEGLPWMLADPRRLMVRPRDGLWVRIVDVPGALTARTYRRDGRMVLDIADAFCPWASGRFELDVSGGRATSKPATATPDVSMSIGELGALYLGGVRPRALATAGRLHGEEGAIERLDAMFVGEITPWCAEIF